MNEIAVLPMMLDHVDEVLAIEVLCFSQPWSRQAFEEQVLSPFTCYLVASAGGRLSGYAGMYVVLDEAHVTNVAVHPDQRGQGLGRRLMESLIQAAISRGAVHMDLEVRTQNQVARNLYQSMGFRQVGRRPGYYQEPKDDALILRLAPLVAPP